jgi:hypothetical protein
MIACDSDVGGLFHKRCVGYDEGQELEEERCHWYCPACDTLLDDPENFDELPEELAGINLSSNALEGLVTAVREAVESVPAETFLQGFQTRQAIMKRIVDANGRNDYDIHWRPHPSKRGKGEELAQ